jgi:hypothetical protein
MKAFLVAVVMGLVFASALTLLALAVGWVLA